MADQNMSEFTHDVKVWLNDRQHKVLTAMSQTSGRPMGEILRSLATPEMEQQVKHAESIVAVLRDDTGSVRKGAEGS